MKTMKQTLLWVVIFAIGMAFLESAVVVYLRNMFYPNGFTFPIVQLNRQIAITEVLREAATILMLISIGFLAAKKTIVLFAYFILAFAIWDIFYYIFLYLLMGWPESLLDWDILFMIPVTWFGPVITPVLIAVLMIILALIIIYYNQKHENIKLKPIDWFLLIAGSTIVVLSWTWDTMGYFVRHFSFHRLFEINLRELLEKFSLSYVPEHFPWFVYICGCIIIFSAILNFFRRQLAMI